MTRTIPDAEGHVRGCVLGHALIRLKVVLQDAPIAPVDVADAPEGVEADVRMAAAVVLEVAEAPAPEGVVEDALADARAETKALMAAPEARAMGAGRLLVRPDAKVLRSPTLLLLRHAPLAMEHVVQRVQMAVAELVKKYVPYYAVPIVKHYVDMDAIGIAKIPITFVLMQRARAIAMDAVPNVEADVIVAAIAYALEDVRAIVKVVRVHALEDA